MPYLLLLSAELLKEVERLRVVANEHYLIRRIRPDLMQEAAKTK